MVLTLIICFLVIVILAFLRDEIALKISKKVTSISFKESLDLTDLPIITVENNGKKLNFLLDTGSNVSHINSNILDSLSDYSKVPAAPTEITTVNGVESIEGSWIELPFYYKKQYFSETFLPLDLTDAFDSIKRDNGVQLHGILGNSFFAKYRYVLDFDDFIAYTK